MKHFFCVILLCCSIAATACSSPIASNGSYEVSEVSTFYKLFTGGVSQMVWDKLLSGEISISLTSGCKNSINNLRHDLHKGLATPYRFIDSSSKGFPGLLHGTVSSFGDYDQCLDISYGHSTGMYCMAMFALDEANLPDLEISEQLTKRIPVAKFFIPFAGLCLPSTCSIDDVQIIAREATSHYHLTLQEVTHCDTQDSISVKFERFTKAQIVSLVFVGTFFSLVGLATFLDIIFDSQILDHFSLKNNFRKLVSIDDDKNRLVGADIMKGLFSIVSVILHSKIAAVSKHGLYNMQRINDIENAVTVLWMQPFINSHSLANMAYLSGLVIGWGILPLARKDATFSYISQIIQRVIKFTPGLACLVAIEFLWPFMGSGPLYTFEARDVLSDCTNTWWQVLTFTVNMNHAMENCVNQTFYSAIDMQLFLLGLIAVYLMVKSTRAGIIYSLFLITADFVITALVSHHLDTGHNLASHPVEVPKLLNYLDYIHYKPYSYMASYFIGFLVGAALAGGFIIKMSRTWFFIGFFIFNATGYSIGVYNSFDTLSKSYIPLFFVAVKLLYATGISLMVVSSAMTGKVGTPKKTKGNPANDIKSATMVKPRHWSDNFTQAIASLLIPLTRLSTALYLSNYYFVRWDFFTNRVLLETRSFTFFRRFTYTVFFAVLLAAAFHLVFLAPLENLRKAYFHKKKDTESNENPSEVNATKKID